MYVKIKSNNTKLNQLNQTKCEVALVFGWVGLGLTGLVQVELVWAIVGTVLGWTKVVEGSGSQEVAMSRLDCVGIETVLSIPHKLDHELLVVV